MVHGGEVFIVSLRSISVSLRKTRRKGPAKGCPTPIVSMWWVVVAAATQNQTPKMITIIFHDCTCNDIADYNNHNDDVAVEGNMRV